VVTKDYFNFFNSRKKDELRGDAGSHIKRDKLASEGGGSEKAGG